MTAPAAVETIRRTLARLHRPGDVFEIRLPKTRQRTVRGYFDDVDAAVDACATWSGRASAVYVTLNPVDRALLARAANRLEPYAETTTQDAEITARRWLLVDLDPVRPSGISSSDEELGAARELARAVYQGLRAAGWPAPLSALSGNGAHLLYRVELPNDADSGRLVQRCLQALAQGYDTERVRIDTGVYNASRISKVYGTLACKGDDTAERPHRLAELLSEGDDTPVSIEQLQALAAQYTAPEPQRSRPGAQRRVGDKPDEETLRDALRHIAPDDYQVWLTVGAALHTEGLRALWDEWSARGASYSDKAQEQKWRSFKPSGSGSGARAGVGTIFHLAQQAGWAFPKGKKYQVEKRTARDRAAARAPEPSGDWQARLGRTKEGAVRPDIANVALILDHDPAWAGVLVYCEFSYRVLKRQAPPWRDAETGEWSDGDTARLRIWMAEHYQCVPRAQDTDDAVEVVAQRHRVHPVREYLEALGWDGTPRLREWLTDALGVDNDAYSQAVGVKWMVGAVARVMRPPVKCDNVLILEGPQGLGKSQALAILGGEWFSDTHFELGDKDGYQQMQGVWLCELSELDSFNKAESARAKAFFSSINDRYRVSYGRRARDHPRQCVFAGSTNQDSYLKDVTGNRRYWPVQCRELDEAYLRETRDQLWAEAVRLYRDGATWWPGGVEIPLFEPQQEARLQQDVWESMIAAWLDAPERRCSNAFTGAEILAECLSMRPNEMKPPEQTRLGLVMHRLGWSKGRATREGRRIWVYRRPFAERMPRHE